jgi:catechol 2,3-dioxygenase-like lactoylglutathione lyase family enzyme
MATPDLLGIVTHDMASSLAFYRLLGVDIPVGAESEGHVEVTLPGGFRLAWDSIEVIRSFNDDWPEPTGHRMGFAFRCDGPADVDRLHAEVVAAGHASHKEPWDAVWGQRYAVVVDPDGNLIDLFADA